MSAFSAPTSPTSVTLPSTPTLADAGLAAAGCANYTVLNGRLAVNISGEHYELLRGDIVTLHRSAAKDMLHGGMIGIVP